jgi:RF-1 domain
MKKLRTLSDQALLADCRFEAFRGSGPGGQKRNKTSSAVRLTHAPSGLSVIAGESRSQHRNRQVAIERLRHKIALSVREKIDLSGLPDPNVLGVSCHSENYPAAMGKTLDVLTHAGWKISSAAKLLGVSTGRLVDFLRTDAQLWMEVNRKRQSAGFRGLNA